MVKAAGNAFTIDNSIKFDLRCSGGLSRRTSRMVFL